MKEQKNIFYISAVIGILSLICSVAGEYKFDYLIRFSFPLISGHREFWVNACLGVFSGCILSSIISLRSYYLNKTKLLFEYWNELENHIQMLNMFGCQYFKYGSTTDECILQIEQSPHILNDILSLETSYTELAKLRREVSYFFKCSELRGVVAEAFDIAGKINIELTQISCVYLCNELSTAKKRSYLNQFNKKDSNLDRLRDVTQKLQKMIGIEVQKIDLENEGIVCHN